MEIERSSLLLADLEPGQAIQVQTADGKLHDLTVAGISHEVAAAPAFYVGRVFGHVTPETLQRLGFGNTYDEPGSSSTTRPSTATASVR